MKKARNSNIEILRILSMLFIVLSHYTVHNGISNISIPLGINRIILEISTLGNIGVILFILISGYFMIEQKEIKINKLFSLYLQVLFYSIVIYLLLVVLNLQTFSIKDLIKTLFPISFNQYWFMTAYIVMYIFTPFINKFINPLKRKEHLNFIVIMLLIFSILPTITTQSYYGNELIQFIMFYSIGAYLKKYPNNIFSKNKKTTKITLIISIILLIVPTILLNILGTKISLFNNFLLHLFNRNSIIAIIFSISLFNLFINKKEFNNKLINKISSCVLGVYLIHDNSYIREILWNDIFKNYNYVNSNYLILHLIISVSLTFISCIIIEFIRKNSIEKITNKLFNNKLEWLQNYLQKKVNYIHKKLAK